MLHPRGFPLLRPGQIVCTMLTEHTPGCKTSEVQKFFESTMISKLSVKLVKKVTVDPKYYHEHWCIAKHSDAKADLFTHGL